MTPQKRVPAKAKDTVKVEPASAAQPRPGPTTPSKKAVAEAVEKSAEYLEQQSQPSTDVHPKPTTPSSSEVEAALEQSAQFVQEQSAEPTDVHVNPTTPSKADVQAAIEQSAEHLESQGVTVDPSSSGAVLSARNLSQDSAPVSAVGPDSALAARPVSAGRDKSQDASPVFSAPVPDKPQE